jgi:hypothetical protein
VKEQRQTRYVIFFDKWLNADNSKACMYTVTITTGEKDFLLVDKRFWYTFLKDKHSRQQVFLVIEG